MAEKKISYGHIDLILFYIFEKRIKLHNYDS